MVLARFNGSPLRPEPEQESAHETSTALPCRFMSPDRLRSGRRYPLLVFLHGADQRGSDNIRQLRGLPEQMALSVWRKRFPCFLCAPQCPRWEKLVAVDGRTRAHDRGPRSGLTLSIVAASI